ncbi:carboxypeptidase regulatory-like domain-containing protein [Actinacidiphila acididurans]|uniref:Carboxypeptidase regulatory-like domain-containing protein n=1 Tax=Actinacidiphila acididurans TaxID=2784346 RepID=A0ABS2TXE6_9ACTN|nr:carboxypeptidase regulatory-like domain-containing protein [Actinacidiphila acididurans]MBM9507646.1 carboxypeptidase regulatory-like domain-containing protein [Actinacidiphila acididurans]
MAVLGIQVPAQAASSAPAAPAASTDSHQLLEPACATPKAGQFTCYALRRADIKPVKGLMPALTPTGWGAPDLESAYNLSTDGGAGQTVAIVDAFDDPNAEADLAVYRSQYGLPECTTANGCFSKVDQRGGTSYPTPDAGWSGEISLDLDMVSAIAPNAHILLVEADDNSFDNLGSSVNEAVALGAKFVSNSYGSDYRGGNGEDPTETTVLDAYYNHPGVAVTVSTGDYAYGVGYPAASQYVTAVGGTTLTRDTTTARGWTESAWNDAGSGCSMYEPKPAWQHDTGCDKRALADVSAVAAGVAVYQTYGNGGWTVYGGTSVSSPIIASVYADAGTPVAGTYPNSYPYAAASGINDVTTGSNGSCTPSYLCNGTTGYDGPTGLGTPDGVEAFRTGPHGVLAGTVTDASTGKPVQGATVTAGTDTAKTDATGTYTLPVPAGTYDVSVAAFGYTTATATGVDVGDGATVTKSFALTPVPSHTVAGKVTDGSGHGWPLYAKITVDGAPGTVWTDPASGAYTVKLPEGHDYTLHVTASNPGYQSVTKTVTVGTADQTVNLPVPADPWATAAPGYQINTTGTTEPFDATTAPPAGWSVVNADGTTGGWEFDDPGNRGNHTGGTGGFAIADSDHFGGAASQDTQLISPAYDFTGNNNPEVAFNTQYQAYNGQSAEVDATSDGGTTWTKVWSTTTSVAGPAKIEVPLSGFAGKPAVQLRFHFISHFGWWWSVDNVFVGDRELVPTPGALVVGTVSDANTGSGVVGATVTDGTDATQTATTVATPDDPNLGDGYYSLFDTNFGSHGFAAAKGHYTTQTKSVNVAADSAVKADFSLAAGQVTVTPASVDATVPWAGSKTQTVTVKNTGGAPATVKLGEQSGGFKIQAAGAPLITAKGDYTALSSKAHQVAGATAPAAGPSDAAWAPAPDYPSAIMDNAVGSYDGKVYSAFGFTGSADSKDMYALDPVAGTWSKLASATDTREDPAHGFIDGKFYAAGGWGPSGSPDPKLEIYDPGSDSWTTGASAPKPYAGSGTAVLDGKLYMIGGCGASTCGTTDATVYDAATDTWSAIASYPEPISWEACGAVNELIYCAGGLNSSNADVAHTYVYDPSVNTWSQLADMPATQWGTSYTAANGLLLLAGGVSNNALTNRAQAFDPVAGTWSALPNPSTPTYRGGGAPGFYKVGGGDAPSHPTAKAEVLAGYDQVGSADVTWLGESTNQLTVQPGASAQVTVTLDASVPEVTQPGDYSAQLSVGTDTPYTVPRIPVTLHVNPPKTWGKITGTVLGVTATGGTAPLAGATVQIDTWATSYTLTTGSDGTYALWLDTRNNPLTLIVAKDGYQPTTTTVKIQKGATTTSNFTLKRK